MADLRIVDAPLLSTVKGTEKIPTGGEGNFSVSVNQVADFAKLKWFLATEEYVVNAVGNVQADLNLHKNNSSNPHGVTKVQVGLGNVDNTADLDKPISNATQSAIITANSGKADKSYVDTQNNIKADKTTVEASLLLKADKVDLTASKIASDGGQTQQEINDFGGAKWWSKPLGYKVGSTVKLENGDIVKSTVPNNTVNPNVDMTGWVKTGDASQITTSSGLNQEEVNALKAGKTEVLPHTQTQESFKNAYSAKRTNQFSRLRDMTACGRAYIWKNPKYSDDIAYRFSLGVNQSGWKTAEWEFIADADGFYRMRYGFVGDIRAPTTTITATNLSKTPQRAGDNAYFRSTTELNATFDVVFNGVGILFNHYVDNNGGIFEVSVDGGTPFIISTHMDNPQNASAMSARMSNKIGGNLEKTTHTATFKFIGNDPKYPPASGVSRGWFKYNDGIDPEDYTANPVTGGEMGLAAANNMLLSNNILEFAINATPVGSGFAGDWVPAHGSASGAMVINKRSIFIDNDVLDDTLSIISSEREIKEFTMVQEYTAYNTNDTSKIYPMWKGTLTTKFNRETGLSYNHSFARDKGAAYDIFVTEGYTASCSGQRLTNTGAVVFTKITHDNGFEVDISAPPPEVQITHLSGILKSVMWIGPKYGLAMNVESPEASGAIGRDTTDGNITFTTERPDRFNKVYFKPLGSNKLIKAGEEFNSKHSLWLSIF